jgi:hypothetical protein
MNELDEVWTQMLNQAIAAAKNAGQSDIAASNDSIRSIGCQWLFDSLTELSEISNRKGIKLEIESESPHSFAVGHSKMVGSLIRFRHGIRCLTAETGWTRTPADGFMHKGALAHAKISHFGMRNNNAELHLLKTNQDSPNWFWIGLDGEKIEIDSSYLQHHFQIFLDMDDLQ